MSKAKTTGKIIAIILCCAIVFFLLLPFLDSPKATVSAEEKKATPQIFTSNPLTDLVNKIYALVTGNKKRTGSRSAAAGTKPGETESLSSSQWTADARQASSNDTSASANASSYPATYGYADAGMINEDGEWVLVRQTAPDTAQRGMHDIKSSDTPYDRLVRQERAAKFTGAPSTNGKNKKDIPVSKWARLWNPVKNFFTGEENAVSETDVPQRALLASAASSDSYEERRTGSNTGRTRDSLNMNLGPFHFSGAAGNDRSNAPGLFGMFNPEFMLQGVVDSLKKMASSDLDPKQQAQFGKDIDQYKNSKYEQMRQKFLDKIARDAQDQAPEDLALRTNGCGSGAKGLYGSGNSCSSAPLSPEQLAQKAQEQTALAKKAQANSLAILSELAGIPLNPKDLNMAVVLGVAKRPPVVSRKDLAYEMEPDEYKNIQRQDQALEGFYNYMLQAQGCNKKPCYWVGSDRQPDPAMQNSIISSGMNYEGDPLHITEGLIEGYRQQQMEKAKTEEERQNAEKITEDLQAYPAYYLAYSQQDMAQLNQRNAFDPQAPRKPEKPLTLYVPSAANTQEILQQGDWDSPGVIIYGEDILNEEKELSVTERGNRLRDQLVQRVRDAMEMAENSSEDLTRFGMSRILQQSKPRSTKPSEGGNFSELADERMGL